MGFKFPSFSDIGVNAAGEVLRGGSAGDIASGAFNGLSSKVISSGIDSIQNKFLPRGLSLGGLLTDPGSAVADFFASNNATSGWMPKLKARPDPLLEIDWVPFLPLGLADEYVEEMAFSHSRINASTGIFRNGTHVFIAENITNAPLNCVFYEDRTMTVTRWLYKWRALITPDNIHFNYPAKYKKDIRVFAKDAKGYTVGQFLFSGCFPTSFPQVNFVSEGSPRARLQVEFSVDRIMFTPVGAAADGGAVGSFLTGLADNAFSGVKGLVNSTVGDLSSAGKAGLNNLITSIKF